MNLISQLLADLKNKEKGCLIFLGGSVVLFLITAFTFLSIILHPIIVEPVLNVDSENVKSIQIVKINNKIDTIFKNAESTLIIDKKQITKICDEITHAKSFYNQHPKVIWSVVLNIETKNDALSVKVSNSENNGTFLTFQSNTTWGLGLGSYRTNSLGTIIENLFPVIHKK